MKLGTSEVKQSTDKTFSNLFLHFTINSFLKSGNQIQKSDSDNSQDRFLEHMVQTQYFSLIKSLENRLFFIKKKKKGCKVKLGITVLLSMKFDNGQMG